MKTLQKYGKYLLTAINNMLKNTRDGCEAVNDAYLPARNSILKRYLCTVIRNNTITHKSEALCIDGPADIAAPDESKSGEIMRVPDE